MGGFTLNGYVGGSGLISSPYFSKLAAQDGDPLWAMNLAFSGISYPKYLAVDKEGNLYFAADIEYSAVSDGESIPVLENGDFFTNLIRYGSKDLLLGMIKGPKGDGDGRLSWLESYGGSNAESVAGLQLDKGEKKLWVLANSDSPSWTFDDSGVTIDNNNDQKGFIGLVEAKTGAAITAYGDWGGVPGQGVATLKSLAYDSKKGYLYVSGIYGGLVSLGEYDNGEEVLLNGPLEQPAGIFVVKFHGDAPAGSKVKQTKAGTKRKSWLNVVWAKSFTGSTDINARADVASTAIGPKGDLYLLTDFSSKTYTFGTTTLTNPGYNTSLADSWTAYALIKMDWKSTVLAATESLVPEMPAILGLSAFAQPCIALDKVGHLYLFGTALPTYTYLDQPLPTYTATTVGTCSELSFVPQDSSNIFSAKYSTLDCVEDGVKCTAAKGCLPKKNKQLFFSNLKE